MHKNIWKITYKSLNYDFSSGKEDGGRQGKKFKVFFLDLQLLKEQNKTKL